MYFAVYDENEKLKWIGEKSEISGNETEISKEVYQNIANEMNMKQQWCNLIYADESRINEVPEKWRDDILNEVHKQKAAEHAAKENISDAEFADMVEGIL